MAYFITNYSENLENLLNNAVKTKNHLKNLIKNIRPKEKEVAEKIFQYHITGFYKCECCESAETYEGKCNHCKFGNTGKSPLNENLNIDFYSASESLQRLMKECLGWQVVKYFNEEDQISFIKKNSEAFKYIENPSETVQLMVAKQNSFSIDDIKYASQINSVSEEIQLMILKQNGLAIKYIAYPTERIEWEAVYQNGLAIQYIKNPSEEMKWRAIYQNGFAIKYIKNPTENMRIEAAYFIAEAITKNNN